MAQPTPETPGWSQRRWVLPAVVIAGLLVRIALLPTPGYVDDIDTFVGWVGDITRSGLGHAYDTPLSFGPVLVFIWWILGLVDPAIVAAASSSDVGVRVAMKLPAVAADLAMAGVAWWALRQRPGWATAAVALLLLHPAIWFVSAWWGTYDSVYAAFGLAAFVLAIRGRDSLAIVALVLAVMAKPQAMPLVVPFAAWFVARAGWRDPDGRPAVGQAVRRLASWAIVGVGTLTLLWLPFLAADGPTHYLASLGQYQGETFALLSISAWNPWWILQELLAGGKYITDSSVLIGSLNFRVAGYLLTLAGLMVVGLCVARRPTARQLALGLAASAMVAFQLLTTMHERYAFAVLPVVAFLLDSRRMRWFIAAFGTLITLNLVSPTDRYLGVLVPFHGPVTIVGSALAFVAMVFLVAEVIRGSRQPEEVSVINQIAAGAAEASPRRTSASSAGATSAA
jgi:Gpi18-like mannosyltransferase